MYRQQRSDEEIGGRVVDVFLRRRGKPSDQDQAGHQERRRGILFLDEMACGPAVRRLPVAVQHNHRRQSDGAENQLVVYGAIWQFFRGPAQVYGDNYANVLYAVLVKIITNAVPREHKQALRTCVSNVLDHRSAAMVPHISGVLVTDPGELAAIRAHSIYTHSRILMLWEMIKSALDIVIGIPEGEVFEISESEVESFYDRINLIETIWREGDGTNKTDRVLAYLHGLL